MSFSTIPICGDALKATDAAGATNLFAMIYRQRANAQMRRSDKEAPVEDLAAATAMSADDGFTALLDRASTERSANASGRPPISEKPRSSPGRAMTR